MAMIVNLLDKGRKIEIINLAGMMTAFSERADGCYYMVEDICGGRLEGKASATKNARSCAVAFLERKGKHALAEKLKPEYQEQPRYWRSSPVHAAA